MHTKNTVSRSNARRLEDWAKANEKIIGESRLTYDQVATMATKALGFSVSKGNLPGVYRTMGIPTPRISGSHPAHSQILTARVNALTDACTAMVKHLYTERGNAIPADVVAALALAGHANNEPAKTVKPEN